MPSIVLHDAAIQKLCHGALAHLHAALTQTKQIPLRDPFLQMGARIAAENGLPENRLLLLLRSVIEQGLHQVSLGAHPAAVFKAIEQELATLFDHFSLSSTTSAEPLHLDCVNLSPTPRTLSNVQIVIADRPSIQEVILLLRKSGPILFLVDTIGDVALSTLILNRFYTKEPICVVKKGKLLPPVQTAKKAHVDTTETTLAFQDHQEKCFALATAPDLNFVTPHTAELFKKPITHALLTRSLATIQKAVRTLFLSPVLISKK